MSLQHEILLILSFISLSTSWLLVQQGLFIVQFHRYQDLNQDPLVRRRRRRRRRRKELFSNFAAVSIAVSGGETLNSAGKYRGKIFIKENVIRLKHLCLTIWKLHLELQQVNGPIYPFQNKKVFQSQSLREGRKDFSMAIPFSNIFF